MEFLPLQFDRSGWLLLLLFPIGFWLTEDLFAHQWNDYVVLNVISLLAGWLVLLRLRRITPESIPIMAILGILIAGYYIKFYFLVHGILDGMDRWELSILIGSIAPTFATNVRLMQCFEVITWSFVAFAVVSFFLLRSQKKLELREAKTEAGCGDQASEPGGPHPAGATPAEYSIDQLDQVPMHHFALPRKVQMPAVRRRSRTT